MTFICAEMHFDYYTYMEQPTWFIEKLALFFEQKYKQNRKTRR